ncbi:GM13429 [Drosophila sechellia]|uniref:GM13429 n=1 Tax=Drosophila sechellia TaxID=7238 RepID=B4IF65_DROSE|nr:GM13429 [Drosophila sechellia]
MSIKIYLPLNYYYIKKPTNLYGQVQINEDNVVSYYVLEASDLEFSDKAINHEKGNLRFLGSILNEDFNADQNQFLKFNMRLCFTYNSSQANITLVYLGITPEYLKHIKMILYDKQMYVIDELYGLLKVLEGSPIGLKLNIHLNNFFLDCFKYHIELWSTFLDFIEPLVRQVFLAIGMIGCLGFTFQIALLVDLISVIGLHSHCFYIYTKVLYNVERRGLSVLWQVVRGNRYNILKGRTESHNYMNRQLYLATIFFSAILFLLPTTLVYYIVFAALKALTFATLSVFDFLRRKLMYLPIEVCIKRLLRGCHEIDCIQIKDVSHHERAFLMHKQQKINVTVYKITTL